MVRLMVVLAILLTMCYYSYQTVLMVKKDVGSMKGAVTNYYDQLDQVMKEMDNQ